MTIEELRKEYAEQLGKADALAQEWEAKEEAMPEEIAEQINSHLGKSDELKAKLETFGEIAERREWLDKSAGLTAAHLGWRKAGPDEGLDQVDPKEWREAEYKTLAIDPVYGVPIETTKTIRYHVPVAVQARDYPSAFEAYVRKGISELGPQDRKTLSEAVDSAGGFLVPEDYQASIIKKVAAMATIRANAMVMSTSRDIVKWPRITYTTDDLYTSGVRMSWTGESPASATTHRVTDPVFGLYSIPVHTSMASMPLSNDLLEDSAFDVAGISGDLLAEAFALGENDAFLNGNGIARPMGLLSQVDGDGPASVASGNASALTADGIIDVAYALPAQYERNAKFFMNKATEKAIRKLRSDSGAGAGTGDYLWPIVPSVGNFGPAPRELLGFPVIREEFMPDIASNAYPIVFGDMSGYAVIDRVGLSIQRLSEIYAETNITLLLARKRVGGQCIQPWRFRVQKVST